MLTLNKKISWFSWEASYVHVFTDVVVSIESSFKLQSQHVSSSWNSAAFSMVSMRRLSLRRRALTPCEGQREPNETWGEHVFSTHQKERGPPLGTRSAGLDWLGTRSIQMEPRYVSSSRKILLRRALHGSLTDHVFKKLPLTDSLSVNATNLEPCKRAAKDKPRQAVPTFQALVWPSSGHLV